jgi:hypothetical protein
LVDVPLSLVAELAASMSVLVVAAVASVVDVVELLVA